MDTLKIAIVGASISGSACAIILQRLGYDVTIYEKSADKVEKRGTGIMLPHALVDTLKTENFIDATFPTIPVNECLRFTYDVEQKQQHLLVTTPLQLVAANWEILHRQLKSRVNHQNLHYQTCVTQVINKHSSVELTLNNQKKEQFDYVIFADGYHSIGRQTIYPNLTPNFANYFGWRGLVEINKEDCDQLFGSDYHHQHIWYLYQKGHFLLYSIPNNNDNFLINWMLYENIDDNHPLFKDNMSLASKNIIAGSMTQPYIDYLHQLATKYLPIFPRELVFRTQQPFTQAIYDLLIPNYVFDHLCLIGDASVLLRPHVASGATKALQNALALEENLTSTSNFETAISTWNTTQSKTAKDLFYLGQDLGKLFVSEVPDWQQLDEAKWKILWESVVSKYNWYAVKK